jgi:arylsulfatase A-like enzyme
MPTILHIFDLPEPARLDGVSFAPLLDGPMPQREPVFAEANHPFWDPRFDSDPVWANQDKYQCVTDGRMKYMYRKPDDVRLYFDRHNDAGEQTNLLETGGGFELTYFEQLRAHLDAWRQNLDPLQSPSMRSEAAQTRLQALGYAGGNESPCNE